MKKVSSLILVICLSFVLMACGYEINGDISDDDSQTVLTKTESSDIEETSDSTEASKPSQSSNPTETSKPAQSSKPTEISKPAKSSKPTETSGIAESSAPEKVQTHSVPTHVHSFSSATCTEPAKCSCGAINGNAKGHSFSNATCTSAAKCTFCGVTTGSAKGHSWVAATYIAPKTCSVCKITEGDPIAVPNFENYHGHVYTGGSSSKKYHYEAKCAGKNSHEITWDEVARRNLGPCGTCVLK